MMRFFFCTLSNKKTLFSMKIDIYIVNFIYISYHYGKGKIAKDKYKREVYYGIYS